MILGTMIGSGLSFDARQVLAKPTASAATAATSGATAGSAAATAAAATGEEVVITARTDERIRISAGKTAESIKSVLGEKDPSSNVLSILYDTGGMLFPYTPSITVAQSVNWDPLTLVHTNFDVHTYQRTPSVNISLSGVFTAQNQREGEYLMAVLHFLRVVTKSYYGAEDQKNGKAGIPPPVLYLYGYGDFMFRGIPVVIKSYNYTLDENTDSSIFWSRSNQSARLPAKMTISVELGVQIGMSKQKNDFNLDDFRTGKLLAEGGTFF